MRPRRSLIVLAASAGTACGDVPDAALPELRELAACAAIEAAR